jgi:hypothetical protein
MVHSSESLQLKVPVGRAAQWAFPQYCPLGFAF